MDVESFLAAQLWLHAVHPDAWPAEASPSIAAAASAGRASTSSGRNSGDDLENVILSGARCCLLLSDDITSSSRRRHRLRFLATNTRQPREHFIGNPGCFRAGVQGSDGHEINGREKLSRSEGEEVDSTGEFDFGLAIVQGLVSTPGGDRAAAAAAAAAAEAGIRGDCGIKEAMPSPRDDARCPRESGNGSNSNSSSSSGTVSDKRGGILLLRIGGRVYQAEHTLIRRIAYPRGGGESFGGDAADSRVDEEEKTNDHVEGCSGGPREQSPRLREDMDTGCAYSQVDPLKDVRDFRSGSSFTVGGRSSSLSKVTVKLAASDRPKIPRGVEGMGAGVSGKRRKLSDGGVDGVICGLEEERHGHGVSRGERGVDRVNGGSVVRHRYERGVSSSENREDDVSRRKTEDCNNCRGVVMANSREELEDDDNRGNIGSEDSAEETLFCGLLFPGVFLKFWLPRRLGHYSDRRSKVVVRAKVVGRMQGVVTDMMRGLSSSSRVHPLAYGSAQPEGPVGSAWLEARQLDLDGLRSRRDAWDEFVYGSHVVLRLEREKIEDLQAEDQVEGERSGCLGDDGAKSTEGPPSQRSSDVGEESLPCSGGLSVLADCFSRARVPSGARSSLQMELQDAEVHAERSLESALDGAFPLELSQWTDREFRASKVAELEACLARARSAKEGLVHLALLPAPEMLREANSDAL